MQVSIMGGPDNPTYLVVVSSTRTNGHDKV
jgi:hypothetical protein